MRASLTHLSRNKTLLVGLVAATVLALVGTATAYAAMSRTVTLSVDGKEREVRTFAKDVGAVLAGQGIEPGARDVVVPAVEAEVNDGSRIAVRLARPLDLTVDGEKKTFWTTATKVSAALDQIGMRIGSAAELSVSRGASIDRSGMALEVVTPKRVSVQVANAKADRHNIAAATVGELLTEVKANVDRNDVVRPSRSAALTDGTRVVVTKIGVKTKRVAREAIPAPVRKEKDSSMMSGETKTVREGRAGARDVTYKIRFRNGQVVKRTVVKQAVISRPVAGIVKVGTKTVNTGVWDAIAACESGGNWSANTGNGYYGGLQFLPSTFNAYGGSGMPHQNSREQQIAVAERVAAAEGGYGAWPHCGAKFG